MMKLESELEVHFEMVLAYRMLGGGGVVLDYNVFCFVLLLNTTILTSSRDIIALSVS